MKPTFDAPQADRLDLVRRVVEAVGAGATDSATIAAQAQIASRYALYALHAARLLELLEADTASPPKVTQRGRSLLETGRGSTAERQALRAAFAQSQALAPIAGVVLAAETPTAAQIAEHLFRPGSVALSTALRRAGTLLAWRRYLLPQDDGPQLRFAALEWGGEVDDVEPPSGSSGNQPLGPVEAPPAATSSPLLEPLPSEPTDGPTQSSKDALPDTLSPPIPAAAPSQDDVSATIDPPAPLIDASAQQGPLVRDNDLAYLRRQIELGTAILFTGAGFSLGARDSRGTRLPTGEGFARELWAICYPGEPFDSSSLQDIFEHAHRRHRRQLEEALQSRFQIDALALPSWYGKWFSMPWAKVYTLNVDDLESATERQFSVPRRLRTVTALRDAHGGGGDSLDVVHLNGVATDGPDGVTFSTEQFAQRLAGQEPFYAQLAVEVLTRPFVFVGSPLEEPLLWQHLAMRGSRAHNSESELRPRGFLVSPDLNRARADKLRAYHIVWIQGTAEEFAERVLSQLSDVAALGLRRLQIATSANTGDERNIVEVQQAVLERGRRTAFLLGEEPSWQDIRDGLAVERDEDAPRLQRLRKLAASPRAPTASPPIFAVTATAGAGKTTLLMKIALQLHADGRRVAWVGSDAEVAPPALARYYRADDRPPVIIVDDAGRYGSQLAPMLTGLVKADALRLIVLGLRSYHQHWLDTPAGSSFAVERHSIGRLTDNDIDRLLGALERERRLGELRGRTPAQRRAAFRERAERQILVAMLEATSGERFEDKVIAEWQSQEAVARYVYALTALATAQGYSLSREEVLLACSGGVREMAALKSLEGSRLLSQESGRYRVRHRVIAETLVEELTERGTHLEKLVTGLCRALALQTGTEEPRNSRRRRVLKHLLNHNALPRLLDDTESAKNVYAQLESHLEEDYHFWLQRGCLELEDGDIRHAQNFLEQAAAINASDPLVETALAHMHLRKAIVNPAGPEAEKLSTKAFDTLRRLSAVRGASDYYPAHVFGSQAVAWCRRATLTPRARTALLREAKEIVGRAISTHRMKPELKQLLDDLTREELQPR